MVFFRMQEPRDVAYLREYIGSDADDLPERIRNLDTTRHECLEWDDENGLTDPGEASEASDEPDEPENEPLPEGVADDTEVE